MTAAARQNPTPILGHVGNEERKAQYEAIHGSWSRGGRRSLDHAEAIDRFDELAELRKEVRRVGDVAQAAIEALRAVGHDSEASRLQRELGMTVEMLRHTDAAV